MTAGLAARASHGIPAETTIGALHAAVTTQLATAGVPDAAVDARWLIAYACGIDPHLAPIALVDPAAAALSQAVARRIAREPLQLIVGSAPFLALDIVCEPGVFIPRPETEVLALEAIRRARTLPAPVRIVEPCTGTGAIAAALFASVARAHIIASDIDGSAVGLARRNLQRVADGTAGGQRAPGSRAEVRHGSLLSPAESLRGSIDVLVANPPYLPAADERSWSQEVANHDPRRALVGGPGGHEVVDRLIESAPDFLAPGGHVLIEIDARQADAAAARAAAVGLVDVELLDDLTGRPRVLAAIDARERSHR